jgi:hypothetical protein
MSLDSPVLRVLGKTGQHSGAGVVDQAMRLLD